MSSIALRLRPIPWLVLWGACLLLPITGSANPALEGYSTYDQLKARAEKLAEHELVTLTSLGDTHGEREVLLLTLATGEADSKPAMLIAGDVVPGEVVGSEMVLRMLEQLLARADEKEVQQLLARRTFYFLPRPSPDAAEKCFAKPYREPRGNATPTDDDRDGETGEDPPADLNDDGWITQMRVEDPAGEYLPHPDDPRVLIQADVAKQERGRYKLYIEGRDADGDEQFAEDGSGGVNFNRNFTFQYPTFKPHAGPHQVSEAETRAVADFCFDHPNIGMVWTMTPEDNLVRPWKADSSKDRARIRTTIHADDAKFQDVIAAKYKKLRDAKEPPGAAEGEGSFSKWAYFHYGRWSLATRPWWIPPTEARPAEGEQEAKKSDEKRGAEELNALRYFAEKEIDGFADWQAFEHPDLPGRKVEIGGFKPFYRTHPPIAEVEPLAAKKVDFLLEVMALAPALELDQLKAETLGGGVVRLSVKILNTGYLPTLPEMGQVSQQGYPLQITWTVPEKTVWIQGTPRTRISRVVVGTPQEQTWLVRLPEPLPKELSIRVAAPSVGAVDATVPLAEEK